MNITLIAGSNRTDAASTNVLRYIERLLNARRIAVSFLDLREMPLPFFSPGAESLDPNVRSLQQSVANADGLILATPEYHGSVSGLLKNALDYLNGTHVGGKPVLSVSAAGGPTGVGSLTHLQSIVRNLHGINCPEWISVGYGTNGFGPDGAPSDEGTRQRIETALANLLDLTRTLALKAETV
ncbi:NADPH-dependent FMN reductase [Paenibacillus flagellatus]|uniref:NADPH-dependent FMN reductase n=1 Tax=Paenibacillus flagellatus TaxID=2211139 RepID=A0A2V5K0R2_9BACL|nr:NADPH-dependent FMN reductase [Paenibacillus flagellatus]PYI52701.1 NADPH-dependent FMN reductase [Paenibacillus flagellatus]